MVARKVQEIPSSIRNCRISLQFLVWKLADEDKVLVYRARKIHSCHSVHVAENFTGIKGVYVPLKETIPQFKAI